MNIRKFETEITRIIPSFAGFTEFTTSVPKIYWDVKSQEQRILGICKMLDKVICYADMLGENVDEIAKTLQDIKDGKLDELITAAIEAWFAEHEDQILQDITDLQARADTLENAVTALQQADVDEAAYREAADNQLANDIGAEMNARKQADAKLEKRTSLHNDVYGFVKPFKFSNDKNGLYIETDQLEAEDFENFTYAGKTLDEIFDPDAAWCYYVQPETLNGYPNIGDVVPIINGETSYNADESYFVFNSWNEYAEQTANIRWNNIPVPTGHRLAYFAEFENLEFKQGTGGFGSSNAYVYTSGNKGIKEIVGFVKESTTGNITIIFGTLPAAASVYSFVAPNMKLKASNLCIVDLDVLFANGQTDEIAKFSNAFYLHCASRDIESVKFETMVKTIDIADISDEEAYDNFIELMNDYAFNMQFINSQFNSASGLPAYPGVEGFNINLNNFSCPIDMLKVLLAASTNSYLHYVLTQRYKKITIGQGRQKTSVTPPNGMINADINLSYKRLYGKGGSLSRSVTGTYAPYGILNTITACTLKNGHTGYISLFNTPYSNPGGGLKYDDLWRYYYCIQVALNQIIDGTDPSQITYMTDLQNGINLASQPTSFAAFVAPEGFDKASIVSQPVSTLLAWLKTEAKLYIGNNDGSNEGDTQVITASCAKLLTAYIAVNECSLDDVITFSEKDFIGGSGYYTFSAGWKTKDASMTLKDAIAGMLYWSDNAIATAIARHVGKVVAGKSNIGSGLLYL